MAWKDWSRQYKFATVFITAIVVLAIVGLAWDLCGKDGYFWFQRSGALLCLAGLEAQYVKLLDQVDGKGPSSVSWHDTLGMSLIIVGTLVWGFGDLFVKLILGQA